MSLSSNSESTCTTVAGTKNIYITIETADTGTITGTLTSDDDSYTTIGISSCLTTTTTLECELASPLDDKVYTLTSLVTNTASTTFTLTDVANTKIGYQQETVGLGTQIEGQTITTEYKFTVVLEDESKAAPSIYVESESNEVSCVRTQGNLIELVCTADATIMPENKSYNILYKHVELSKTQT